LKRHEFKDDRRMLKLSKYDNSKTKCSSPSSENNVNLFTCYGSPFLPAPKTPVSPRVLAFIKLVFHHRCPFMSAQEINFFAN